MELDDSKIYIQVYQIFLEGMPGWCSSKIADMREELEALNDDYYRDESEKCINVDFVLNCLALMGAGDEVSFKDVTFRSFLLDYKEYNNMPEFTGW